MLSAADWDQRYQQKDTPWDLTGPTPELLRLVPSLPPSGRALVPGGGRGHDALALAQHGMETHLVDFAPTAIDEARALGKSIHLHCLDFFTLPEIPSHHAAYDLIWEYTFFCAIAPDLRARYVATIEKLLKPGGLFLGLFFPLVSEKSPPPFVVTESEVRALFPATLQIEKPQASVKPRAGREFLGFYRKPAR